MANLVMSAWRVSSAAASTSDVVFSDSFLQEHEPFSGGAMCLDSNPFFSIERKAFEAFHSDECDLFLFLTFLLFDFALLACKQLEMYDDDEIRRLVGILHLIEFLMTREHVGLLRFGWSRLAQGPGGQRKGTHVHCYTTLDPGKSRPHRLKDNLISKTRLN